MSSRVKWLPLMAVIWFFATIDSFFTWNRFSLVFRLLPSLIIIYGSLPFLTRGEHLAKSKIIVIPLLTFSLWKLQMFDGYGLALFNLLEFFPIFCILFWPLEYIKKMYLLIRNIFVFYAVGSAFFSILAFFGLLESIPHFELPPQETIHELSDAHYNLYGVFVYITHSDQIIGLTRSCGMTLEPGHFSVYLGFIYLIERFRGERYTLISLIIGAIFTFSSAFFIILIITEFSVFLSNLSIKSFIKCIVYVPILILLVFVIFSLLPSDTQDQLVYKFYERNLSAVLDVLNSTGSLDNALNERASVNSIAKYDRLGVIDILIGGTKIGKGGMLSDYRGLIMNVGFVGMLMSIFAYLSILRSASRKQAIALFLSYILIMLHRSWMLYNSYIYTFAFLSVVLCSSPNQWLCRELSKIKIDEPLSTSNT